MLSRFGWRLLGLLGLFGPLAVATLLGGCAVANPPMRVQAPPHHVVGGFRNNHIDSVDKPLADLLRWRLEAMRDGLPRKPSRPTPQAWPDLEAVRGYAGPGGGDGKAVPLPPPQLTWIGHATLPVQAGGLGVLTNPIFSVRASPLSWLGPRRAQPPGLAQAMARAAMGVGDDVFALMVIGETRRIAPRRR